jgi:hypothetical protein
VQPPRSIRGSRAPDAGRSVCLCGTLRDEPPSRELRCLACPDVEDCLSLGASPGICHSHPQKPGDSRTASAPSRDHRGRVWCWPTCGHTRSEQQKRPPEGGRRLGAPGRTRTCGQALRRRLALPVRQAPDLRCWPRKLLWFTNFDTHSAEVVKETRFGGSHHPATPSDISDTGRAMSLAALVQIAC